MKELKISPNRAKAFTIDFLCALGMEKDNAIQAADAIIYADISGIRTHGLERLPSYYRSFQAGLINAKAKPHILQTNHCYVQVDACNTMGHSTAVFCMEKAIETAERTGIGIVLASNANHYGCAGYYALMPVKHHMIGITATNTRALVVPTNARQAFLGTNPIAFGMYAEPWPFLLDMATSVITGGKVELHGREQRPLEEGWAIDAKGRPEKAALQVSKNIQAGSGGILPLGGFGETWSGHKGYGLSVMVEILTSILAGSYTSDQIGSGFAEERISQIFVALDYSFLGEQSQVERRLSEYLKHLRELRPICEEKPVRTHGQKEFIMAEQCEATGILVSDRTREQLLELSRSLNLHDAEDQLASINTSNFAQ